jgi:beta-N-acetylhexosaminidase
VARERLAAAGRRVADLAAWVRAAPARPGGADGVDVVSRVAEVAGDVRIGRGAHVLDLRGAVNIADGRAGEPRVVEALRRHDPTVTAGPGTPPGRPLVVVVRGPSAAFDAVRAARPDAVAVHVGLPGDWRPCAPSVTVWGDGHAHAQVVARLLHP